MKDELFKYYVTCILAQLTLHYNPLHKAFYKNTKLLHNYKPGSWWRPKQAFHVHWFIQETLCFIFSHFNTKYILYYFCARPSEWMSIKRWGREEDKKGPHAGYTFLRFTSGGFGVTNTSNCETLHNTYHHHSRENRSEKRARFFILLISIHSNIIHLSSLLEIYVLGSTGQ